MSGGTGAAGYSWYRGWPYVEAVAASEYAEESDGGLGCLASDS